MKYLVFLGASHHLRYLEYICGYFNIKKADIHLNLFCNSHQLNFNNADISDFKKVNYFIEESFFNIKSSQRIRKRFIQNFLLDINPNDELRLFTCISYDYAVIFRSVFKKTEVFLLDDGFGFFSTVNYFSNKKYLILLRYFALSLLTRSLLGNPFRFRFFSEFNHENLTPKKIIRYSKNKIQFLDRTIDDKLILFLGTIEVELKLIDISYYLNLIESIATRYQNFKFHYYPHRKEDASKLKRIQEIGFDIIYPELPFENYLLKTDSVPAYIVGFTSSNAVYELLSKFDSTLKFILIDNLTKEYKMPSLIKAGILNCYRNYNIEMYNIS